MPDTLAAAKRPTVLTLAGLPARAGQLVRRLAPWSDEPEKLSVAVLGIVVGWVVVAVAVLILAALVARVYGPHVARQESVEHAEVTTAAFADRAIAPLVTNALLAGDPAAYQAIDDVVRPRVVDGSMSMVRIRNRAGLVVFADEPGLAGQHLPLLGRNAQRTLLTGGSRAELSLLDTEATFFGPGFPDEQVLVQAGFRGKDGKRYLFESSVASPKFPDTERRLILELAVVVVLLVGAFLYLPLAVFLTRRLRRSRTDRTSLLHQARSASLTERRKLAQALHDDVVQDLAGLGYALSASVAHPPANANPQTQAVLSTADGIVHHSIHRLREILADIYPLHVEQTDLARAVDELAEPVRRRGVRATVSVRGTERLSPATKTMLYRTARELLRNVENHARAKNVTVEVATDGEGAVIRVEDDGVGFDATLGLPPTGHVGLVILMDAVRDRGGQFTLTSAPGDGCTVVVSLPDPRRETAPPVVG